MQTQAGFEISFGADGNSDEFVMLGWAGVEPRHRWTVGPKSQIKLPRLTVQTDVYLTFQAVPIRKRSTVQAPTIAIIVNGKFMKQINLKNDVSTYGLLIRSDVLNRESENYLDFIHPEFAVPGDLDVDDGRRLAVAMHKITVRPMEFSLFEAPVLLSRAEMVEDPQERHKLATIFQSLGQNCEFGMFQRGCGAEPLGLLRFSSIVISKLIHGLDTRFGGIDKPENLVLSLNREKTEYIGRHAIYGLDYHTFRGEEIGDVQDFQKKEAVRLEFLARLLMEEIEAASKIFVIQRSVPLLDEYEVFALLNVLSSYNKETRLLWVTLAPSERPDLIGRVEQLGPSLFKGYIDNFAPAENVPQFSFQPWLEICASTVAVADVMNGSLASGFG